MAVEIWAHRGNSFQFPENTMEAFASALGKTVHIVHIPTDFMFSLGRQEVAHRESLKWLWPRR